MAKQNTNERNPNLVNHSQIVFEYECWNNCELWFTQIANAWAECKWENSSVNHSQIDWLSLAISAEIIVSSYALDFRLARLEKSPMHFVGNQWWLFSIPDSTPKQSIYVGGCVYSFVFELENPQLIIGWEGEDLGPGGIWGQVQGVGSDH